MIVPDPERELLALLRDSAEGFLSANHDPRSLRGGIGQPRRADARAWSQMAELGWVALGLPESLGGSGLGVRAAASLCALFGQRLFPEPYIAASVMPSFLLRALGDRADAMQSRALAGALASGERRIALAWQDVSGSDTAFAGAELRDGRLYGAKTFVPAFERDGVAVVGATVHGEPGWLIVRGDAENLIDDVAATAQGTSSNLQFEGSPASVLCRGKDAALAWPQVRRAATTCAAAQLAGLAEGCLALTSAYVMQRVQFGHPLSQFQTVAHRCADLVIASRMAHATWHHAAAVALAGDDASADGAVSAAKARCSDVALMVGRTAVQLHGGMGFTEESDIGMFLRAAMQYAAWLGNGTAHRRRFLHAQWTPEVTHG